MIKPHVDELTFDLRRISDLAGDVEGCLRSDIGQLRYEAPAVIYRLMDEIGPLEVFDYAPTYGEPSLLKVLEKFEAEHLKNFDDPKILVTAGAQAALFSIMSAVVEAGDLVLTDRVYYPPYQSLTKILEADLMAHDFADLADEKDWYSQVKIVVINAPNNPTGQTYDPETLKTIACLAKKYNWLIIEDAVYDQIHFEDQAISIATMLPAQTIRVTSASKNICVPGMRIGWCFGPQNLIVPITKIHRNINSCPNVFFQKVLAQSLSSLDDYFVDLRQEMKTRRDLMCQIFVDLGWELEMPKGAIYVFPKTKERDSAELAEKLINEVGVSSIPGKLFGEVNKSHLRFCYGAMSMEEITEMGSRLNQYFKTK